MDDYVGIPEDLRCKRSDGKQWRCRALSMPDKTVCEKHYVQAKRRAATSAARAMERKAKRKSLGEADVYVDSRNNDTEISRSVSPMNIGGGSSDTLAPLIKYKEKVNKSQLLYSPEKKSERGFLGNQFLPIPTEKGRRYAAQVEESYYRRIYGTSLVGKEMNLNGNALGEHGGRSSGSSGDNDRLACHYCGRIDRTKLVWCSTCERRGYCHVCLSRWYADIPLEDIHRVCPACRGICTCTVCLLSDNIVQAKVHEMAAIDKLRYLHSLLKCALPILNKVYEEEIFEIGVETRAHGFKDNIPRAKLETDEKLCCDFCRNTILDYHRHCMNCSYDLCLTCCWDLRRDSKVSFREPAEGLLNERSKVKPLALEKLEPSERSTRDECPIDFALLFPKWRASSDGSIPCGPVEAGGCGSAKLILRRIFKINWVAKLVKCAEEMVNGCIVHNLDGFKKCFSCSGSTTSDLSGSSESFLRQCSSRDHCNDFSLYTPESEEIRHEGINHFHTHWAKGEPIIVKRVFESQLSSSWEPLNIWRAMQETTGNKMDERILVKVLDCRNDSEVEMELSQFIKGYSEGHKRDDGKQEILKLNKWPSPTALEEFLLCQRPEFLVNFPLIEFFHSKWGILNLAAKLPYDALQNVGPRLVISYGIQTDLDRSDPVTNLQYKIGDQVYLLVHTADARQALKRHGTEKGLKIPEESAMKKESGSSGIDRVDSYEKTHAGAIWDVYRRQDVPKLHEYLKMQQFKVTDQLNASAKHPIYDQTICLNKDHKRKLKEEWGIEPWSFEQHVGEAVFIPAGCPFQMMNHQSSMQLVIDFLSPESLNESARMAQEIRCLPDGHQKKIEMLEASKVSLYAASWAIREIQQIVLDPKLRPEIKFEDHNLTVPVAEHLERVAKQQLIYS